MVIYSEGCIINSYAAEPPNPVLHLDDPAIRAFINDFLAQYCREPEADSRPKSTTFSVPSKYKQEILYCLAAILAKFRQQDPDTPDFLKGIVSSETIPPADILVFDRTECTRGSVLSKIQNGINELQGYCRENLQIAELERSMCKSNVYEDFKKHYFELTGTPWSIARNNFLSDDEDMVYTLKQVGFMEEKDARTYLFRAYCHWDYPITRKDFLSRLQEREGRCLVCILHSSNEERTQELIGRFDALDSRLLWPIIMSE